MEINTDSVTSATEYLDLALKDLNSAVDRLTTGKASCSVNCPDYSMVLNQAIGLRDLCSDALNGCNTFIENVTNDDVKIGAIVEEESEIINLDPIVSFKGYDAVIVKDDNLVTERDNLNTKYMTVHEGYLVKVIERNKDENWALVLCYRNNDGTGHLGYVKDDSLLETGSSSNLGISIDETSFYARVEKSNVNVRETPGGRHLTQVDELTYVKVTGFVPVPDYSNDHSWYIVTYRNDDGDITTGFVRDDMVKSFDSKENMLQDYQQRDNRGVVTGEKVNFRSAPDTSNKNNILEKLDKNSRFKILEEYADWYYISYEGQEGYISKNYSSRELKQNFPIELSNLGFE